MGLFSFGGSRSESRSSGRSFSQSDSFGQSSSFQGSESGSVSGGVSRAGSEDRSQGISSQDIAFEDVFSRLFGGAEAASAALDPSLLTDASNQLFSGGMGVLDRLGGDVGSEFLQGRLTDENPLLQDQIDLLGEDLGDFFSEELNPAITSEAVGAGQLGGGRQGVAQGRAAELVGEQFTRGATALRAGDLARRDAIAGGLADRSLAGAQTELNASPMLLQLAQAGFGAEFMPTQMLASILGDPTVLTQSRQEARGTSFSDAMDFARAFSESFGASQATDESRSRSASRTDSFSSSGSIKFGFGG